MKTRLLVLVILLTAAATNFTLYVGQADGGAVVDAIFNDDSARFIYLEVLRRF